MGLPFGQSGSAFFLAGSVDVVHAEILNQETHFRKVEESLEIGNIYETTTTFESVLEWNVPV